MATGAALAASSPDLSPACASEAALNQLVSSYYKLFHEELASDLVFLTSIQRHPDIESCRKLIRDLRTVAQHTGNTHAKSVVKTWRSLFPSPQEAATELARSVAVALARLAAVAGVARRNGAVAARWRDVALIQPATVFVVVARDLGLRLPTYKQQFMVRQVEGRLKVEPGAGDRRLHISDLCAQEIVSSHRTLPVPYVDVLDALNLLGKAGADAAVTLAYAVAEVAPQLKGEPFIERVKQTYISAGGIAKSPSG
ncbi:hypothetical protein [Microbacterium sp.]|uniref:hypothetical protein n=1 Tax=Microbacterium sp. TaxID=51671 RepID=UPI002732698D|nr:hypothetical protein [Microbacterium sp.]MDP3952990.1 hypothetical protein [Microbacterium sp.]